MLRSKPEKSMSESIGVILKTNSASATPKGFEDKELVNLAREGDVNSFRALVERYQHRVLLVAQSIIGRREDAEDIVQEAFLKAFRNLSSFKGESSFYTWLYRIVFNLAIDEQRKRYRHMETSTGDLHTLSSFAEQGKDGSNSALLSRGSDPENEFENSQLRQHLSEAIKTLSPAHRAVIILREIDGLSYAEISDVVGCSKGTVMSRLHHARKKLQEALRELQADKGVGDGESNDGKSKNVEGSNNV